MAESTSLQAGNEQIRAALQSLVDDLREERFDFHFKRPADEMHAKGISNPEFDKGYANAIHGAVQIAERHVAALDGQTARTPTVPSQQNESDWWITTDFFNKGGRKIMGPFVSRDLAMQVRTLRETVEGHATYFIDSEPHLPPVSTSVEEADRG